MLRRDETPESSIDAKYQRRLKRAKKSGVVRTSLSVGNRQEPVAKIS